MTLLLIASMTSGLARADNREIKQGIYTTIPVGPIGTAWSSSGVGVNGRTFYGQQTIWCGDLIQAPSNTNASILLDSVGQINLATGAAMTIATTLSKQGDEAVHRVLIASVIEGKISVRLQPEASAYIEARGSAINADKGASFRLRVEDQNAQVDTFIGEVLVEPQRRTRKFIGFHGDPDPNTKAFNITSKSIDVDPFGSKRVGLKLETKKESDRRVKKFMPVQNEPAKQVLIRFTLAPPTIGRLDPQEAITDNLGIAETTFTAGANAGKGKFIATVVENPKYKYSRDIVIGKPIVKSPGRFRLRNILIAAGAIGAIIIICCARPSNPEKRDPPIIIEP
jgi:hypothetical protein